MGEASEQPTWGLVDGREAKTLEFDGVTARIAGVSLVSRHLRMAARQGWEGVVVWVDPSSREAMEGAIEAQPAPDALRVEVVNASEQPPGDRRYVSLELAAIYEAKTLAKAGETDEATAPEPMMKLRTRSDTKRVTGRLLRLHRKTMDHDGVVAWLLVRRLSEAMTHVLVNTRVSPNAVTLVAMAFGIAAAILAGLGGSTPVILAGVFYWVGMAVDCVDGELARLRLQTSKAGEWLDTLADDISTYGLLAGLGVGMVADGYTDMWLILSVVAAALGMALQIKIYADLHKWKLPIDTAQYPWFFGTPSDESSKPSGFFGQAFRMISFVFRRDAFVTIIAILLVLGQRRLSVLALSFGVGIVVALYVVHVIVIAVTDNDREPGGWSIGYFGVKDLFTLINLMGGVGGIYFAFHGNVEYAGYSILAGYLLGDVPDGQVARLTGTSNRFGSDFDAASDHLSQAIVPAIIAYVAFAQAGHEMLGLAVMATHAATASIRQARFTVAKFNYPLVYCGLPRTVSGLIAISYPNANLFFHYSVIPYEGAAALLIFVAILNLCPIPYMTHKGDRKMQAYIKPFVFAFLTAPAAFILFAPEFAYDVLFFITFGYALTAWIPIRPDERRAFWTEYRRWAKDISSH